MPKNQSRRTQKVIIITSPQATLYSTNNPSSPELKTLQRTSNPRNKILGSVIEDGRLGNSKHTGNIGRVIVIGLALDSSGIGDVISCSDGGRDEIEIGIDGDTDGNGHLNKGIGHNLKCERGCLGSYCWRDGCDG